MESLKKEYSLIMNKTSKLSKAKRDEIVKLVTANKTKMKPIEIKAKKILLEDVSLPQAKYKKGDVVFVEDISFEKPFVILGIKYENGEIGEAGFSNDKENLNIKNHAELIEYCSNLFMPYLGKNTQHIVYSHD